MISKRILIRSVIIICGSFLFGFLALWWLEGDIKAQASKVELAKIELSRELNLAPAVAVLTNEAERASVYEKRLSSLLPSKDKLLDFRNFVEALAGQRGVDVAFAFEGEGGTMNEGNLGAIGFSLRMSGPEAGIRGLIEDIELKPRSYLLSLDTFDFSRTGTEYQVVFYGKLFYKEINS